jgi:hypothetical protein
MRAALSYDLAGGGVWTTQKTRAAEAEILREIKLNRDGSGGGEADVAEDDFFPRMTTTELAARAGLERPLSGKPKRHSSSSRPMSAHAGGGAGGGEFGKMSSGILSGGAGLRHLPPPSARGVGLCVALNDAHWSALYV